MRVFTIPFVRQMTPGHQLADLRFRELRDRPLRHLLTVAQHDHFAADRIALVELVAHEQHRHAFGAQIREHGDQVVDFLLRERGGGLVHDDELRLARNGPRNCYELPRGERQLLDQRRLKICIAGQTNGFERTCRRARQRAPVEGAGEPACVRGQFGRERDIFRHTHVRQQRQILIHRFDARRERFERGEPRMAHAFDDEFAFVRRLRAGDDLDERALAAAVLAEQVIDLPALEREAHAAQRMHAGETLVHADHLQKRLRMAGRRGQR